MSDHSITRLLDLITRELGALEARVEFGGTPPDDPVTLWASLPGGWRVVTRFDKPRDDAKHLSLKLRQLAASFFEVPPEPPRPYPEGYTNWTTRRLDDELCSLAARTGAVSAVVIDFQSPVLWGTSEPRIGDENVTSAQKVAQLAEMAERGGVRLVDLTNLPEEQVDETLARAELNEGSRATLRRELGRLRSLDPKQRFAEVLTSRAIAQVRRPGTEDSPNSGHFREVVHKEDLGYLARSFSGIYVALLVFKNTYSELHAEAALLHALPVIERLVFALPPIEPPPKGGQVVKLPVPGS